jgi:general secretion pathway protein L
MTTLQPVATVFSWWIDAVMRAAATSLKGLRPARRVEIEEHDEGDFTLRLLAEPKREVSLMPARVEIANGHFAPLSAEWAAALRGSQIDLLLLPKHFLFRAYELPSRAAEFLDNVVRAQIDRLTPWSAGQAAYHWTSPRTLAGERISVTIVATGLATVTSLATTLSDAGAAAVEVATVTEEAERVVVYGTRAAGQTEARLLRPALIAVLAGAVAIAMASMGISDFLVERYDAQKQQVQRRIADRMAILRDKSGGAGSAVELLEQRKQATMSGAIVIEALSALLPDHTYATELRIEGGKVQVVGLTRDAPSLISLLEQSPHFARAAFFAPTTHAANETGERFHIEATIKPYFGPGS